MLLPLAITAAEKTVESSPTSIFVQYGRKSSRATKLKDSKDDNGLSLYYIDE